METAKPFDEFSNKKGFGISYETFKGFRKCTHDQNLFRFRNAPIFFRVRSNFKKAPIEHARHMQSIVLIEVALTRKIVSPQTMPNRMTFAMLTFHPELWCWMARISLLAS